jgi:hypothetical protein
MNHTSGRIILIGFNRLSVKLDNLSSNSGKTIRFERRFSHPLFPLSSFEQDLRSRITRGLETGEAHARSNFFRPVRRMNSLLLIFTAAMNYIRDDQAFLPKVGVVTIAGLGGLLLGHKSGVLRKTLYSSAAVAVALSACYPKQSANLFDQFSSRIKIESGNLVNSKRCLFLRLCKRNCLFDRDYSGGECRT